MSLATEGRYDLAVDTDALRHAGAQYSEIADNLRRIAERLDNCLMDLKDSGWTTGAGKAFQTINDETKGTRTTGIANFRLNLLSLNLGLAVCI